MDETKASIPFFQGCLWSTPSLQLPPSKWPLLLKEQYRSMVLHMEELQNVSMAEPWRTWLRNYKNGSPSKSFYLIHPCK